MKKITIFLSTALAYILFVGCNDQHPKNVSLLLKDSTFQKSLIELTQKTNGIIKDTLNGMEIAYLISPLELDSTEQIPQTEAQSILSNYTTSKAKVAGFPKNFLIEKKYIDALFRNNSTANGIAIYPCKTTNDNTKNDYSLVIAGAKFTPLASQTDQTKNGDVDTTKPYQVLQSGQLYEHIFRCPSYCPTGATNGF